MPSIFAGRYLHIHEKPCQELLPPKNTLWALLALFLLGQAACNTDKTVSQTEKAAKTAPANQEYSKEQLADLKKDLASRKAALANQETSKEESVTSVDSKKTAQKKKKQQRVKDSKASNADSIVRDFS